METCNNRPSSFRAFKEKISYITGQNFMAKDFNKIDCTESAIKSLEKGLCPLNIFENDFQRQFQELQNYLDQVLNEWTNEFPSLPDRKEEIALAKEYFKNYASEIFIHIKNAFENTHLYLLFPRDYVTQVVIKIKEQVKAKLQDLTTQINYSGGEKVKSQLVSQSKKIRKKAQKGKSKIDKKAIIVLKNWLTEHFQDPYRTHLEKVQLATETGLTFKQVQNWFTNVRGRHWKIASKTEKFHPLPRIEKNIQTMEREEIGESLILPPVYYEKIMPVTVQIHSLGTNFLLFNHLR